MEKKIVVFIGVQGSGKSYNAQWHADFSDDPTTTLAFADAVYLIAKSLVGSQLTEEICRSKHNFKHAKFTINGIEMSGRQVLQMIGEGARLVNPRVWIDRLLSNVTDAFLRSLAWSRDELTVLIDDCRYPNEVLALIDYAKNKNCRIDFVHCKYKLTPSEDIPGERMANYFCTNEFSYKNLIKYCMENE